MYVMYIPSIPYKKLKTSFVFLGCLSRIRLKTTVPIYKKIDYTWPKCNSIVHLDL